MVAGEVEVAVGPAGDDPIAHGELAVAAGDDLLVPEVAVRAEELARQPVQVAPGDVPAVHHGMVVAGEPRLPPPLKHPGV